VHNDNVADKLTGSSGQDLFFISLGDTVTGRHSDELVILI